MFKKSNRVIFRTIIPENTRNKVNIQTEQLWAFRPPWRTTEVTKNVTRASCLLLKPFLVEFFQDIKQLYIFTFRKIESNHVEQPFPRYPCEYCC